MSLSDETLLAFARREPKPFHGSWVSRSVNPGGVVPFVRPADAVVTFADAARHIAVIGQTGAGKTVGAMRPALHRLIARGCSGLVLDPKGDFIELQEEYPDRVVTVGAGKGCEPINLLRGMPASVFRTWLGQQRAESREAFWGSTALNDAVLVLMYHRAVGEEPTLATIVDALLDPSGFVEEFDAWIETTRTIPSRLLAAIRLQRRNAFGLLSLGGSRLVDYDSQRSESGRAQEQYTWHVQHLLPGLAAAVDDPRILRGLCAVRALDLTDLIYGQRKVVIVDMPEHEFGAASELVGRLLRARYIATILGYPHHAREGYGVDRYTFLVADEYQHHLQLAAGGIGGGVYDDTTAFDRLRTHGHVNIIATQSIAALRARRPAGERPEAVDCLLANVGTAVCFRSNDAHTRAHIGGRLSSRLREKVQDHVAETLDRGEAVIVSSRLDRHAGGLVAAVRTGAVDGAGWMGRDLHYRAPPRATDRYAMPAEDAIPNPHCIAVDSWLALAQEQFSRTRERLLERVRDGWDLDTEEPLARTKLSLGRLSAELSLQMDWQDPVRSTLTIKGLLTDSEAVVFDLPLHPVHRVVEDFPEAALGDAEEAAPLHAHAAAEPLTVERTPFAEQALRLTWNGVWSVALDPDHWRALAWAARSYRALHADLLAARAEINCGPWL